MKEQTNNSKRAQRRATREFNGSRPNRRASERLSRKTNGYRSAINAARGDSSGVTQPGNAKKW